MGRKRKKTNVPDATDLKEASKCFARGTSQDFKTIKDKKLKRELLVQEKKNAQAIRSAALQQLLMPEEQGCLEADEGERTMKFKQTEIVKHVDLGSARKHFSLALPHHGPYKCAYSRNGSKLLIGGQKGHIATFDWQTGKLGCEFHVKETVRDAVWLHNRDYIALAQKKYTYIYDGSGTELHRLKNHINPVHLQYLPYHWLLVSTGATGFLKYHDVSVGKLVVELKTRLGQPHCLSHNPWNSVINLGHSNGTVTMWSPTMKEPLVKMLCHHGPVTAVGVDTTGRHMVTCGMDKQMKVWDVRTYKESLSYYSHRPGSHLAISQTGLFAVSLGGQVQIWKDAFKTKQKAPYMTHQVEGAVIEGLDFANFEDVLGLGHSKGFTSLLIPGAGEANFDALEMNPFESKRQKQETEVKMLLNKIPAELISLKAESIHEIKPEEAEKPLEDKELILKFKMKGRNSAKRRFLRREKHIHDEKRLKIRAALDSDKNEDGESDKPRTMLDRFKSKEI